MNGAGNPRAVRLAMVISGCRWPEQVVHLRQLAAEIAKPFGELALLGVDGVELGGQLLFPVEQPLSVADRTDLTECNLGHRLLHEAATTVLAGKSDGIMMHEGTTLFPELGSLCTTRSCRRRNRTG